MDSKQKYYPHFGYDRPRRTKKECEFPAFYDKNAHRTGIFAVEYHEEGLPGYSCIFKCVNCGREFPFKGNKGFFKPGPRLERIAI